MVVFVVIVLIFCFLCDFVFFWVFEKSVMENYITDFFVTIPKLIRVQRMLARLYQCLIDLNRLNTYVHWQLSKCREYLAVDRLVAG